MRADVANAVPGSFPIGDLPFSPEPHLGFIEPEPRPLDRYISIVVIAAAIIAAVRLARKIDAELSMPSVTSTITQSVLLAKTILAEVKRLS